MLAPAPRSSSSSSSCPVAAAPAPGDTQTALDEAAFGSRDANNRNGANGFAPVAAEDASVVLSMALSVEQRRWLLLRAVELMDKREHSALTQWRHYRCPAPGTLVAPARHEDGKRPVYHLDYREQRCSCPDQTFCDAFNAKCEAAGLPAWARLACKHHRIAQLLSTWRHEFGQARSVCCAAGAQEEPGHEEPGPAQKP